VQTANAIPVQSLQLTASDQDDYMLNVADAYAVDGDLGLARDRLSRLRDPNLVPRIENFAINYAGKRNATSLNLIRLALAMGSKHNSLVAMFITPTNAPPPTATPENAPVFSSVRATEAPTQAPTFTPSHTPPPVYVVVPNDNPVQILPTDTPTITPTPSITPTRLPNTRIPPTETPLPISTAAPPPPVIWEPGYPGGWPPGVYYQPVQVEPGQKYWRLVKAVYCDFIEENFGCPDRPGNTSGTSIYVINGGAPIDVIRPDGVNVGGDPSQIGDLKAPNDPCECSWTMLVSDYRISVVGAPSDAIGGFSLYTVGGNVLAGHAHVRYFLYFDYVTR
jgi:hypothetical protein